MTVVNISQVVIDVVLVLMAGILTIDTVKRWRK